MAVYNIPTIFKGDTFEDLQFTLSIDGVPEDLTDYGISCKFRKRAKTGEEVKSISILSGITLVDATAGVFKIDAFQQDWTPCTYYYDIEFTDGTDINTYVEGTLIIKQDVTY
jgi:hypothetical protein